MDNLADFVDSTLRDGNHIKGNLAFNDTSIVLPSGVLSDTLVEIRTYSDADMATHVHNMHFDLDAIGVPVAKPIGVYTDAAFPMVAIEHINGTAPVINRCDPYAIDRQVSDLRIKYLEAGFIDPADLYGEVADHTSLFPKGFPTRHSDSIVVAGDQYFFTNMQHWRIDKENAAKLLDHEKKAVKKEQSTDMWDILTIHARLHRQTKRELFRSSYPTRSYVVRRPLIGYERIPSIFDVKHENVDPRTLGDLNLSH